MRERIVFAPGANGQELLKNLAMHGVMSFNTRIVGAGELARMALMRSGITITGDFVSAREEAVIIAEAVQDETYFGKANYSDIKQITAAVRRMRSLAATNEAEYIEQAMGSGIFREKNAALVSVYRKYMKLLAERKLLDQIALVRKAVAESTKIDAEFIILDEYPLSPLEKELLNKVADSVRNMPLRELYGVKEGSIHVDSIKNCYGAPNEVETIIADIYKNKTMDSCTVAVTDANTYGQLFFDYALRYDLPVTFGCGIPIINSNPAKLLVLYYHWMTNGFFGAAAVSNMLASDAFDHYKLNELYPPKGEHFKKRILDEVICALRLTNNKVENDERLANFEKALAAEETQADPADEEALLLIKQRKECLPFLKVLAGELELPAEEFIKKYAYIRRGTKTNSQTLLMMLDSASASAIYDELKVIKASASGQATEDMIRHVLKMSVASAGSEAGKVYVTGIDGALVSVRENVYVAGLSATKYPGSPKENYLLLDEDLRLFGEDAERMTSKGQIEKKISNFMALARLSTGLGSKLYLSYAGLNVSELKHDNPSSLLFEVFRAEHGENATSKQLESAIQKIGYFDPEISASRKVGEAYSKGLEVTQTTEAGKVQKADGSGEPAALEKEYSPSALEEFFNCPKQFMLHRILGIEAPDEEDIFEVVSAADSGTLAHSLLETLANSSMSEDEFLKLSAERFDRFVLENPPVVPEKVENERTQFVEMMKNAYEMDPKRKVVLKEEDIHSTHECGVRLHGFPDRIELLEDGSYLVVDFKTGRTVKHVKDDIDTCLQTVIYAYLMEDNKNIKISGAEYRYLKAGEVVTCVYDDAMKGRLSEKLTEFKQALENAEYPISEFAVDREKNDPDPCKYCKYGLICGKTQQGGSEDE